MIALLVVGVEATVVARLDTGPIDSLDQAAEHACHDYEVALEQRSRGDITEEEFLYQIRHVHSHTEHSRNQELQAAASDLLQAAETEDLQQITAEAAQLAQHCELERIEIPTS